MTALRTRQISSLEKVFLNGSCGQRQERLLACGNETVSYQVAYTMEPAAEYNRITINYQVTSPLPGKIQVYRVENVPGELAAYPNQNDDNYLTKEPGLFPDPLFPIPDQGELYAMPRNWHALWIEIQVPSGCAPGEYPICVQMEGDGVSAIEHMTVEVIGTDLPAQAMPCTNWFHVDCISEIHHVPVYSQAHWLLIEQYMGLAVEHGINMILTPVLTPPLDTAVGGERPTVQLVEITKNGEAYTFDFTLLERYIQLGQRLGVRYFEINQMYTQWGAGAAPKVVAWVSGEKTRIFGWDTPAQSKEYKNFLGQLLPALVQFFDQRDMRGQVVFHASDEPDSNHQDAYRAAVETMQSFIDGYPLMDALSDFAFWRKGLAQWPVVAVDHIQPFLDAGCPDLWCYYCCSQNINVPNRFLAMPSYRNRILGVLLYQYQIAGFLHWGFNFYYSGLSKCLVNPFLTTDAMGAFPAGDPFVVYPWQDGPIPSLRLKVFREALQDMRLLKRTEEYAGREAVLAMIQETAGGPVTFSDYPHSDAFLFSLRQKAFAMLSKYIH